MYFLVIAKDKENSQNIRANNRAGHLDFLHAAGNKVKMAGPIIENGNMLGSRLILDMVNLEEVKAWLTQDPYAHAGLFKEVIIEEIKIVIWN